LQNGGSHIVVAVQSAGTDTILIFMNNDPYSLFQLLQVLEVYFWALICFFKGIYFITKFDSFHGIFVIFEVVKKIFRFEHFLHGIYENFLRFFNLFYQLFSFLHLK